MSNAIDLESRKAALRKHLRAQLSEAGADWQAEDSEKIRTRLKQQPVWQNARTVLFFAPLPGEPDLWPLLVEALPAGKIAALPAFNALTGTYQVRQLRDPGREVVSGQFGIREPNSFCPEVPLNGLDLVLVPGIAYDLHGRRLGRGKGYYDRLLEAFGGVKCGVAFDAQIVAEIPTAPHDIHLNCILTPTRWIET